MEEIRVLHVIDNLWPGGTEKQCLELVRGLSSAGNRNAVFYFKSGPLLAEMEDLDVTVRAVPCGSFRSGRFPFRLASLANAIRQCAPTVVQTYGFYSNVPGLLAAFLSRVPVSVAGRRDGGEQIRTAQRRADHWVRRLAHCVVTNSEAGRQQLISQESVAPDKVVVIRNGLNLQHWPRADYQLDNGDPIVGMVAHFREQKDHVTFLRAAKEILKVVPSARFCLVGSGPLEATIRECAYKLGISSRVVFTGLLEGEVLRSVVRQFRVSVLTSKNNEGLPNAVLESMAFGRPVVATAIGGTPEIIEDGVNGFLVSAKDPATLAERIVLLLKDPLLGRSMGQRGRQKVEHEFSVERMVGEYQRLYRSLLESTGQRVA